MSNPPVRRSSVWQHFTDTDTPGRMICNHCGAFVTVSRNSTGNLMRHISRHPNVVLTKLRPKAPPAKEEIPTYYLVKPDVPKVKKSGGTSTANSDSDHTTDAETQAAAENIQYLISNDEDVVDTSTMAEPTVTKHSSYNKNSETVRSANRRPISRRNLAQSGARWRFERPSPRRRSAPFRSRRRHRSPDYPDPDEMFMEIERERWERDDEREIERNELRERELVIQERQIETTIRWQQIAERALDMVQSYLDLK